jgi:hypothetical protein
LYAGTEQGIASVASFLPREMPRKSTAWVWLCCMTYVLNLDIFVCVLFQEYHMRLPIIQIHMLIFAILYVKTQCRVNSYIRETFNVFQNSYALTAYRTFLIFQRRKRYAAIRNTTNIKRRARISSMKSAFSISSSSNVVSGSLKWQYTWKTYAKD